MGFTHFRVFTKGIHGLVSNRAIYTCLGAGSVKGYAMSILKSQMRQLQCFLALLLFSVLGYLNKLT